MSRNRKKKTTDSRLQYWLKYCEMTPKLKKYIRKAGAISEFIWIIVLDLSYSKKGWGIEFESEEELIDMIIFNRNLDLLKSDYVKIEDPKGWVKECLKHMVDCGLLNRRMYKKQMATSKSMQLELMKARKRGNKEKYYTTHELFGEHTLLGQDEWEAYKGDTKFNTKKKATKEVEFEPIMVDEGIDIPFLDPVEPVFPEKLDYDLTSLEKLEENK